MRATKGSRARVPLPRDLAVLLGLSSPARADDVGTAQGVIRAQEQAFSRDDAAAAWVPADDQRLRPQLRALELLHGGEEGVEVEVAEDHETKPRDRTRLRARIEMKGPAL